MSPTSTQLAREYLQQLSGRSLEDTVRLFADLLERVAADERRACAEIAEEVMRLCGSHAAEQIANRIRAGDQEIDL